MTLQAQLSLPKTVLDNQSRPVISCTQRSINKGHIMIRLAKHLLRSTIDAINELDYNSKAYHTVINTRGCIPQWRRDYAGFDEILALVDTLEDEIDDYLIRYKQANN